MFGLGILILVLLFVYGIQLMAKLAIFIDKIKFGNKNTDVTDSIPPPPPVIWPEFTATNSGYVRIYGFSEPKSKVILLKSQDQISDIQADNDGKFSWPEIPLESGDNIFSAMAADAFGNKSHISKTISVSYLNKSPILKMEKPTDKQQFSGADNPIEVKGVTLANTKVYVNNRLASVGSDGGFDIRIILPEGDSSVKIRVLDSAGNETTSEIPVHYQP